jgi:hypothetical protein
MKSKMFGISAVISAVFAAVMLAAGTTGELTDKQLSLHEIETLYVFVQGLTEETKREGLTAEQIQSAVIDRLKQMGIKVVSEEEISKVAGSPVLYVNISANKITGTPTFVYHVDVGVLQKVILVREPEIRFMSITWNRGQIGYCPSINFAKSLRETVGYLMDRFEKDYRAANPKLKEPEKKQRLAD